MAESEKKRGRPSGRTQDIPFMMRVNEGFLGQIDRWREAQPDKPPRAEAIRRLVEKALKRGKP